MKRLLLLLVLTFGVLALNAQIKLSVKAGGNVNVSEFDFSPGDGFADINQPAGFHAGLALKVKVLPIFYLQADAIYNHNSYKFDIIGEGVSKFNMNNIEVPVVFGAQIAFIRLYAGPRFTFDIGNSADLANIEIYDPQVFGYQAGIGLNIMRTITVDLSYNGYFGQAVQTIKSSGGTVHDERLSNRQIWITVGFIIL